MATSPRKLVERFYAEVWNQADESAANEILDVDFLFRGSLGLEMRGPEAFIEYMRSVHAALDSYTCRIDELIVDDSRAAARMSFTGRHRAQFFGVEATDRDITWIGSAFFKMSSAQRIVELWVLGDIDSIKQQLGLSRDETFVRLLSK